MRQLNACLVVTVVVECKTGMLLLMVDVRDILMLDSFTRLS